MKITLALIDPWHPASIAPSVGSNTTAAERGPEPGGVFEHHRQLVFVERALLTCVEHTSRLRWAEGFHEMDHHGQPALHVGGAETVHPIAVHSRPVLALKRHGVEMPDQQNRPLLGLSHHKGIADRLLRQTVETSRNSVPKGCLLAGDRRDVDEPGQSLDQIGQS